MPGSCINCTVTRKQSTILSFLCQRIDSTNAARFAYFTIYRSRGSRVSVIWEASIGPDRSPSNSVIQHGVKQVRLLSALASGFLLADRPAPRLRSLPKSTVSPLSCPHWKKDPTRPGQAENSPETGKLPPSFSSHAAHSSFFLFFTSLINSTSFYFIQNERDYPPHHPGYVNA